MRVMRVMRVMGVHTEIEASRGFVGVGVGVGGTHNSPGRAVKAFEAQLAIVELLEHKALFTAGYKAVMHCHTVRPPHSAPLCLLSAAGRVCPCAWTV